jgi:hypothetical protein
MEFVGNESYDKRRQLATPVHYKGMGCRGGVRNIGTNLVTRCGG